MCPKIAGWGDFNLGQHILHIVEDFQYGALFRKKWVKFTDYWDNGTPKRRQNVHVWKHNGVKYAYNFHLV